VTLAQVNPVALWSGLAAALAGLLGLAELSRRILRGVRQVGRFLDDFFGSEPRAGVSARPGVMERLADAQSVATSAAAAAASAAQAAASAAQASQHALDGLAEHRREVRQSLADVRTDLDKLTTLITQESTP
jgi:hypothetical protein